MTLNYDSVAVGDQLYCLAWVGKRFVVVEKDDSARRVALEGESASDPYGAQLDIFDETMWMVTDQPWDQIWFWPDRAGETYREVYQRWASQHRPGQVVLAYLADTGIASAEGFIQPKPKRSMALRIVGIDDSFAQTTVEPVTLSADPGRRAEPDDLERPADSWVSVGPRAPVRISMVGYRWALGFGDLVLNWQDFAPPISATEPRQ